MRKLIPGIIYLLFCFSSAFGQSYKPEQIYLASSVVPSFSFLNPPELGLFLKNDSSDIQFQLALNYSGNKWEIDGYYNLISNTYDQNIGLAYQLKDNESLSIRSKTTKYYGIGLRIGVSRELMIEKTPVRFCVSINNIISKNTLQTSYGSVYYTDTVAIQGNPQGQKGLHYSYNSLHEINNISYLPVANFTLGIPLSIGNHFQFTPSFLAGIAIFNRGKLENWGRNSLGGDVTISGSFSLSYLLKKSSI